MKVIVATKAKKLVTRKGAALVSTAGIPILASESFVEEDDEPEPDPVTEAAAALPPAAVSVAAAANICSDE